MHINCNGQIGLGLTIITTAYRPNIVVYLLKYSIDMTGSSIHRLNANNLCRNPIV